MFGKWYQLFVIAPEGNGYTTAEAMSHVNDHIMNLFPAMFVSPDCWPIQNSDGTWEVRVLDENALSLVKSVLTDHYGLEIVRQQEND